MKFSDFLKETASTTSAVLDSDGKAVQLAKINQGRSKEPEINVGDIWIKNSSGKTPFKITKVGASIRLDMLDKTTGEPVEGHSGARYHQESKANFLKNYQRETK